jgi:hypothetical protein
MRALTLVLALLLAAGLSASAGQATQKPEGTQVTYGRLKQMTKDQKVVIAIDKAPDKTYNLNSGDTSVNVAEGLVVGDHVKVTESERDGRKHVEIARQTGPEGQGGQERSRTQEQPARK